MQISNIPVIHYRDSQQDQASGDPSEQGHRLRVFLNRLPTGIECAEQEDVCEDTTKRLNSRNLQLSSETPIFYRLERLN